MPEKLFAGKRVNAPLVEVPAAISPLKKPMPPFQSEAGVIIGGVTRRLTSVFWQVELEQASTKNSSTPYGAVAVAEVLKVTTAEPPDVRVTVGFATTKLTFGKFDAGKTCTVTDPEKPAREMSVRVLVPDVPGTIGDRSPYQEPSGKSDAGGGLGGTLTTLTTASWQAPEVVGQARIKYE